MHAPHHDRERQLWTLMLLGPIGILLRRLDLLSRLRSARRVVACLDWMLGVWGSARGSGVRIGEEA